MSSKTPSLKEFFSRKKRVVQIELTEVQGSSPRSADTFMYVGRDDLWGTIGGGQLEFMVVQRAQEMLEQGDLADHLDIPLGPKIGQCCGGRVKATLTRMSPRDQQMAYDREQTIQNQYPHVYIFGAGHVGRALANQMQFLPVNCVLVDARQKELAKCSAKVETRLSALPEADVRSAPANSAFVVLTHDHALDFLLTSEALARNDAKYVGMIGSMTKRAKFASWCRDTPAALNIERLHCPIGANGSSDKRPSVIAAFVVAEIIAELTTGSAAVATPEANSQELKQPSFAKTRNSNGS